MLSGAKLDSALKNRILCRFIKRSPRLSPPGGGTEKRIATIHKTSNFTQLYEKTRALRFCGPSFFTCDRYPP
jgi:hypothetical protein